MASAYRLDHPVWATQDFGMYGRVRHELVLVRHGESAANQAGMAGDCILAHGGNSALTELGQIQAAKLQPLFDKMAGPETLFEVSPLERARDTLGRDRVALVDPDLREFGKTSEGAEYAEPKADFQERVQKTLEQWKRIGTLEKPRRTVVVGHSLFFNEVIRQLMGATTKAFIHQGNTAITVVHFTQAGDGEEHIEIQAVGTVHHLAGSERSGHHTPMYYE